MTIIRSLSEQSGFSEYALGEKNSLEGITGIKTRTKLVMTTRYALSWAVFSRKKQLLGTGEEGPQICPRGKKFAGL